MHCMHDLETFDTTPNSLLWQIGAVSFDKDGVYNEFHSVIKIDEAMMEEFSISASTFNWWLSQPEAIKVLANANQSLYDALDGFAEFYNIWCGGEMWGNGSDFDNVILANAYKKRGIPQPWRYSMNRCFRTIRSVHPHIELPFEGVKHNALADARHQAEYLIRLNEAYSLNIL